MGSNIKSFESSDDAGQPVELYKFTQKGISYYYTSNCEDISITVKEDGKIRTEKYFADHISRAQLQPNTSGSTAGDMQVAVWKDHPVAKLFQGAPPEEPVTVEIHRAHAADVDRYDTVFYGVISQAVFEGSECKLTAKIENWLDKEIPNGMYQYFCVNMIYGPNCGLNKEDWQVDIFIDKIDELTVYSAQFAEYEDGYFAGGCIYFDGQARAIDEHKGNAIKMKYPFLREPHNDAVAVPGCGHLFSTCAKRFRNTDNFTGCPYMPPTDSEKNPVGKGAYWVDSSVIERDSKGFVGNIEM